MSIICFKATLFNIGSWTLLVLPESVSAKLPSRGMVMVEGTINGIPFQAPLEPDGKGGHWLRINEALGKAAEAGAGDSVTLAIEPTKEWPDPRAPSDLNTALTASKQANKVWIDITPMARWDWIRWINATKNQKTRMRRIESACEMLKAGKRRPCCFNRNLCTETEVSKNGVLLEPHKRLGNQG